ncbi:Transglycosylase SLT domain protein [compost metagenome]
MQSMFEAASAQYGVPINVLSALAQQESNYNPNAIGSKTKWGRAKGLMQNIDPTANALGINPFDAEQSIFAAAKQMRERMDKGDPMEEVVMAHFGGDNRNQWGPKTQRYGREVLAKAGIIGKGLLAQQPQQEPEAAQGYDLKAIQAEMDAKEPGRYRVLDPEEVAGHFTKRADIASGRNALGNAADALKPAPSPLTVENQTKFKQQGQPSPLTITNQIRAASGLPPSADAPDGGGSGAGSYLGKSAVAGLYDLAGAGAKVLDAVNPWTFSEADIATIYKDQPEKYQDYLDNSAGMILNRFSKAMTKKSEETMKGLSPEAKANYGGLEYATTDPNKSALLSPVKVIGDAVRSLPSTVALAVSAYVTRGAAQRAEATALAQGAAPEVARQVGIQAGAKTMAQVGASSEGAIGYAQQANQSYQEANKAAIEKSPRYQGLLQDGYTPETARAKIVSETAEEAGKYAGIVDASVNLVGGQFLGKIISEGGSFIPRVMKGFGNEAATETVQSAGEKVGENLATQNNIDPNQSLTEGTGEAAVQGLAVGGLTGGVVAGALGGKGQQQEAPQERIEPTLNDVVDPTATPGSTQDANTPATQAATTPAAVVPTEITPALVTPSGPLTRAAATVVQPEAVLPEEQPAQEQAQPEAAAAQPAGEPVTVRSDDGELPGTLESYQEDGQGNWSARVVAEDGNAYDFTQADGVTLDRPKAPTPVNEVNNVSEPDTASDGDVLGAEAPAPGNADAPAASDRTEAQLRADLKTIAGQLRTDRTNADLKARRKEIEQSINALTKEQAQTPVPAKAAAETVKELTGDKINRAWTKFAPDSGTLDIPRAEMPQIKAEHRGALVNFLEARGVVSTQEEVPAASLKPTQQEFSPAKVKKAKDFKGGDRSILVSSDGHVVDGHHQWMAKLEANEPIKIIRLDAPIAQLLNTVREFPSSTQANGSSAPKVEPTSSLSSTASWVIRNKETGEVIAETFDKKKVDALNTEKYEAVPVQQHLGEVNESIKAGDQTGKIKPKAANKIGIDQKYLNDDSNVDERARAYTIPTVEAMNEALAIVGKKEFEALADGRDATRDSDRMGNEAAMRLEMVARKIVDFNDKQQKNKPAATPEESSVVEAPATMAKNATAQKPAEYGANNKLVSQDRAAELRAKLKAKLNGSQLNAGIDPEILALGTELAVFHIEAGVRKFADFAKTMASDLDMPLEKIRPYLRSWYNGSRDLTEDAGLSIDGMDSADTVRTELAKLTDAPAAEPTAKPEGKVETVSTPAGREFEVQHKVVEAGDLITSNNADGSVNTDYPQELQPRDRGRSASLDQINDIASKLNPRLLGESASATDGAPIVSPDGVVESGNGRTMAIRQAYARNPEAATKYRDWLTSQGYDVEGMKAPVLVRERVTPMDTEELQGYTAEANDRTTLAMSSTERAMGDAKKIGGILHLFRGGDVQSAANREFVKGFMSDVAAKSDRGTMMDGDGMLSQEGRRRIEAALLAAAYGDANIVTDLFESSESDIKAIGGAMLDASGDWALMRQEARDGTIPKGVDVTPHLMEAVNLVRRARAEGRPVYELVNQTDIFAGELSQTTKDFMSVFYRGDSLSRARGRDKVADALLSYTRQARAAQPGDNLFGDPEVTSTDLLRGVNEKLQRQEDQAGQGSLFGGAGTNAERAGGSGREGQGPRSGAEREAAPKSEEGLNATGSRTGLERDRQKPDAEKPVVQAADGDAAGANDGSTERAGDSAGKGGNAGQRDNRVPTDGTTSGREPGDQLVHQRDGQFRPESGAARGAEPAGSGRDSGPGEAVERQRADAIADTAPSSDSKDFAERLAAQKKADGAKTKRADKASIDAALPLLLPEQRDDVFKAEQRLEAGNGMMHTNGTGTGKTASGLGLAKRFINDGKDNIIIVVPSDKIASDWVKFAGMMGIDLKALESTKDNGGKGPVITTYANFASNDSLARRDWDLAITDESHYLSSNEAGETTGALDQLRAITGHHSGFYKSVRDKNPKPYAALQAAIAARPTPEQMLNYSEKDQAAFDKAVEDAQAKWNAIEKPARKAWDERWAKQEGLPKTLFLSATPFPYVKNIDYAEGYLFDYTNPADLKKSEGQGGGYNSGSARDRFIMQHFGYRMRYNKLTQPEAGVDTELMEQNFNQWLKTTGALSGRRLEVPFDYDRKFAMVDDAVGQKIDEGLKYLREEDDGKYRKVYDAVMSNFDYQKRMYLLESIKARAVVPMIKDHMELGRKVVVFHDYNKGGGFDPFTATGMPDEETRNLAREAFSARPDLFKLNLNGLSSPIDTLSAAFPDALFFNGTVPKQKRRENADAFNDDAGDNKLIVLQSDAGREGVSLHDTSGKNMRVLINLGMPGKPVAAIQIEGRTYRTGQASNSPFRYLTTGTAWEAGAFASKIAERASTAENLALGSDARGLKQSFIDAYMNADVAPASAEDGKGGKAYDRQMAAGMQLTGFTKAKTFYYAQQKNTKRRDQREGADYFATPEPLGFKMAEWADIQQGDKVLEPSAGHGAIARFFPEHTDVTMVEPSYELSQRAALANGNARIVNDRFEDLHVSNKYDTIVMNPPYGSGGKTAIEHVSKAAKHLRDGGRIVALIPRGGLADKRLETYLASEEAADLYMVADIQMPPSTFERAGTAVNTHVVVLEKHANPEDAEGIQQRNIDLSGADNINELFDSIEDLGLPARKPSSKPEPKEVLIEHTTGKGKVLRGVIRTGLTKDEAKEIDPFTFKKGDGYFIRAKYLDQAKQSVDAYRGFNADVDGAKFSVQPDGLRSLVEAEPLDLNVSPDLASRPLAEVRAETFTNMLANRSTTMSHPSVGTITFNRAGITKSRSTSNDPAKVLTMGNLSEMVGDAAYLGRSEPEGDNGNIVRYHYLGRRVTVDGEPMVAMMTLRETADGRITYYNHSMLQDVPSIESVTAPVAANDNSKYQRPVLRMERMSLSDGATATPGQVERIRTSLTDGKFGKAVDRLIDSGRIVLHDTVQSLPGESFPGTQAVTMPDGTVHLVAENLTPQTAMPVLLHEMFHAGGKPLVGSKRWGDLQGRLASLHRQFSKSPGKAGEFFEAARKRVEDAQRAGNTMSEGLTAEEFGAYAIEEYERAPAAVRKWVDDVIGAIKEFMFRTFGIQLGQVSPAQLRAMAVQAIRKEATTAPTDDEIRYSLKPSKVFKDLNADQKSFLDKIGPERLPQRLKDRWDQLTDNLSLRVRQAGVDRYAALLRNDQALHGEDTLENSIADSSWVLARMSPSAGGAVSALLNNGRIYHDAKEKVIDIKEGTKGLGETLRKLGSPAEIDRFMGWIAANRSKRLLGEGRENLFTPEEIEAGIKLSGGKLENGKSRSILYAQAWKEFQQHRDDVLGIAESTGIITPEQRQTWSDEFYVPFYRVMDEENVGGPSSGSGISRQQAYKKLKGGKQNLNDLLDNTLLNFHHLLQASLKNQAAAQAMDNAEQLGIAEKTTEAKRDKKASTFVMENGEKQWYNVSDPLTFKAVSSLADAGLNNPVMKIGRAFKRFFTNMTTITPQFVVANAIRDTLAAMATSPTSMVPLKTAFKGALTYGNDSNKARMMASGGAFSFGHVYGQNANEVKASLTSSMRSAKVLSDPKLIPNILLSAWRKYHAVTDFAENINRAGIWEHNKDRGKLKAAFEARDLMDFSAHGDAAIVRIMTDLVPFLNARIQGLDKLYRSGGKPALKTMFGKGSKSDKQSFARFAAVVGALTAMSALLYLRNKDDEDYRKLEDWQRDSYWVVKVGDDMFFIPKPFEVGAIATMGERLLEQFVDPTVGGEKLAGRLGHMLTDTFAFNPIPQVAKPLYELGANENTFTGRPIEDQSMSRLSPSLRSRPDTSRLADAASRGIETALDVVGGKMMALSPVQIDHLIQGYTGAVGAGAVGLADTLWRRASGEELPARRWSEYQPIKRFYKDLTQEDNYTRYGTDFYSALKKADQAYADLQHLAKNGQEERAAAVEEKQADQLAMRSTLNKVNRSMSKINAEMKRIQTDKSMSAEAKRMELDRMRSMRNLMTEEIGKELEKDRAARRASGKP